MASHLGKLFEALLMRFTTEGMFDVLYTIHDRLSALKCSEKFKKRPTTMTKLLDEIVDAS
jgi:hypothetical protein